MVCRYRKIEGAIRRAGEAFDRACSQPLLSGIRGGHALCLRSLSQKRAILLGRLARVDGGRLFFDDSLNENIGFADDAFAKIKRDIDAHIFSQGLMRIFSVKD
jgi:hypothetical protein